LVTTTELEVSPDLLVRLPPDGVFWRVAPVRGDGRVGRFIHGGLIRLTSPGDVIGAHPEPAADAEPRRTVRTRRS
jgi:hypothetical protein